MGLFDKKFCDICGEKISLLGNRKLEDGNMCSSCAKLISPFMTDRKQTSVAEMKEHLAYREANKQALQSFSVTESFGEGKKIYVDKNNGNFIVSFSSPNSWDKENPDVIPLSEVTSCNFDIKENREEIFTKDEQGNRKSYNPPRYKYDYDFYVHIYVSNRWFSEIEIKLNSFDVEGLNSQKYHNFQLMGNQVVAVLTGQQANINPGSGYGTAAALGGAAGFFGALADQIAQNAAQTNTQSVAVTENNPVEEKPAANYTEAEEKEILRQAKTITLQTVQVNGINSEITKCPDSNKTVSGKFCPDCGGKTVPLIQVICSCCNYEVPQEGIVPKNCPACDHLFDADDIIVN